MRKRFLTLFGVLILALFAVLPNHASADATPGDTVVTLGADLTDAQRDAMLKEMGADENTAQVIEVTNKEEHEYLGNYLSEAQIGSRAISSSKITIGEAGSGLSAETHNITYVTEDMYISALATAGVKDAKVYVTAPFSVSGTAALTGLIKAYEKTSGKSIPEAQKQVANEEVVVTADLGEQKNVGKEKAAELVATIKDKIASESPETREDIERIVRDSAQQVQVDLNDADIQKLVDLFDKMIHLDIDWNQMGDQMQQLRDKIDELANSEEAQGFLASVFRAIGDFFSALFNAIASLFK